MGLWGHSGHSRRAAKEKTGEHAVFGNNEAAPLTVANLTVHVVVVPRENQMLLISVEERVSDKTEETLTELALVELLEPAQVEDIEGCHAGEVNSVGQIHFQLLDFLLEVDLVEEQLRHLLPDLGFGSLSLSSDFPLSLLAELCVAAAQR